MKKFLIGVLTAATLMGGALAFSACGSSHTVTVEYLHGAEDGTLKEWSTYTMTVSDNSPASLKEFIHITGLDELHTGMFTAGFFTDAACTQKYTEEPITADTTLYFWEGSPNSYRSIEFVYEENSYFCYVLNGDPLSSDAFAKTAYGKGEAEDYGYFTDEAHTQPLTITGYVPEENVRIYVAENQ